MQLLGITKILAQCIIRPPKDTYKQTQLGKTTICLEGEVYQRKDFNIMVPKYLKSKNQKQLKQTNNNAVIILKASLYRHKYESKPRDTILHLHANSSSRNSVKNYLQLMIKKYDVVTFDFRGCGNSQNCEYITLGYLEKYDVKHVIQYVNTKFGQRKYVIWGRSMGAVTALLYAKKFKNNIYGLVLDSPFCDLQKVANELVRNNAPIIPEFITENILDNVSNYIKEKISNQYGYMFDIRKLKPIQTIRYIEIPIFYIGSQNDDLVRIQHLKNLYEITASKKQIHCLAGGHNQVRSKSLKKKAIKFIEDAFQTQRDFSDKNLRRNRIFTSENNNQQKSILQINCLREQDDKYQTKQISQFKCSKLMLNQNLSNIQQFNNLVSPRVRKPIFGRQKSHRI